MSTNSYDVFSKPGHLEIAKYIIQCCTSVTFINRANKAHAIRGEIRALETAHPCAKEARAAAIVATRIQEATFLFLAHPYVTIHRANSKVVRPYRIIVIVKLYPLLDATAHDNPNSAKSTAHTNPKTQEGGLNFTSAPASLPTLQKAWVP